MKKSLCLFFTILFLLMAAGCNGGEEAKKIKASTETEAKRAEVIPQATPQAAPGPLIATTPPTLSPTDVIAEVDGFKLTRAQLDLEHDHVAHESQA